MASEKRKSISEAGPPTKKVKSENDGARSDRQPMNGKDGFLNGSSSREAHHKQKTLKAERLAAKPNADSIARSKKIWERLRTKSKVEKEDRVNLVGELFDIITGRVKEFVFKHDAVRVIQCALKYASPDQKQQIVDELKGSYRELAESRYAKFLVAKLITIDTKNRDVVVPEFYGHVKRLIRHPEASWIMDDIYRTLASDEQKAKLLREWYGGEFAVLALQDKDEKVSADLAEILKQSPGKRGPIMQHLKEMTNQLVQKKTTGFTMLHDALLQYFLNCVPGTPEHIEFLELLKDDEEGDLFKNLAFTKSGSRVVSLALAYGTPKDRRNILKHYKTHIKLMAHDPSAHLVLLAAYEVIDDTVMTAKAIVPELTCKELDTESREQELLGLALSLVGRIPLLYLMAEEPPKWLLDAPQNAMIEEVRLIRKDTSKKDPPIRRTELNKAISEPLLAFVAAQTATLLQSSFGCQFIGEVMLGGLGDKKEAVTRLVDAITADENAEVLGTPHAGRLCKLLASGGRFDVKTKLVVYPDEPLGFGNSLYESLSHDEVKLLQWAKGPNAWTLVAMLESEQFEHKEPLLRFLTKHSSELQASGSDAGIGAGTKILLAKIGSGSDAQPENKKKSRSKPDTVKEMKSEDNASAVTSERKKKRPKLVETEVEQIAEKTTKKKSKK